MNTKGQVLFAVRSQIYISGRLLKRVIVFWDSSDVLDFILIVYEDVLFNKKSLKYDFNAAICYQTEQF